MEKIFLLDGNYILRRSFYGVPELRTSRGFPTNAIKGTLNTIFYIKETYHPDKIIAAYDTRKPTFRHLMYNGYKATRDPAPEDFLLQYSVIQMVLNSMNIFTINKAGFEADDIIGTIASEESAKGNQIIIYSADHDMLQLVNNNVSLLVPEMSNHPETIWTPQTVKDMYDVTPEQFIDVKALMGDKSDNIPGALGIGPKTACKLVSEYGGLLDIYKNLNNVKSKSTAAKLYGSWDNIMLSYSLVKIKKDVVFSDIELPESAGEIPQNMLNDTSRCMLELYELKSIISVLKNGSIVRV